MGGLGTEQGSGVRAVGERVTLVGRAEGAIAGFETLRLADTRVQGGAEGIVQVVQGQGAPEGLGALGR